MESTEHTKESLEEVNKPEVVKIAEGLGVDPGGNKGDIIDRILDHQASTTAADEPAGDDDKTLVGTPIDAVPDPEPTEDRVEEYDVNGPDGPVRVRHNIDTGDTELV
ncbi:MAG: hypothetical protein J0H98_08135 [Solirubrobacterales bacterium]|nr:hypothetical protein [Solirubrobacterales bacterium]